MKVTIDSGGRLLLPKSLRDSTGLLPGTQVDVSVYGGGVQLTPGGRIALKKYTFKFHLPLHGDSQDSQPDSAAAPRSHAGTEAAAANTSTNADSAADGDKKNAPADAADTSDMPSGDPRP